MAVPFILVAPVPGREHAGEAVEALVDPADRVVLGVDEVDVVGDGIEGDALGTVEGGEPRIGAVAGEPLGTGAGDVEDAAGAPVGDNALGVERAEIGAGGDVGARGVDDALEEFEGVRRFTCGRNMV